MADVPHLVIGLGYGAFGVGAGTYNQQPALAIIPSQDSVAHPDRIGETMIEGLMTEPLPGTIIIAFKDREAIRRHLEILTELMVFVPEESPDA